MKKTYVAGVGTLVSVFIAAILLAGGTPAQCGLTVNTRNALISAISSSANSGKNVCVNGDIDGSTITVTTDFSTPARFIAYPANMTIKLPPVSFNGAHNVSVEGFDVTGGGLSIANSEASDNVRMIGNYIHDFVGNGFTAFGGVTNTNIAFIGNYLKCVEYPLDGNPGGPTGYGVYNDAVAPGMNVSFNTIEGCGNTADGMQLGSLHNANVSNNVIKNISWNGVGNDPHVDSLMLWAGSSNVNVSNNRVINGPDVLISPDGTDITLENNLIVNMTGGNSCVDAHPNGSSGEIHPLRHTYVKNTIVNCASGNAILFDGGSGARNGNVLDRNLFKGIACPGTPGLSAFSNIDLNMFQSANPCSIVGTNTFNFVPTWLNTTNPDDKGYYLATNTSVGYHYTPAGHTAYKLTGKS